MIGSKSKSNIEGFNYDELKKICDNKEELSYSKLCKRINIKELSGNSKIKQIRELSGICKFTKEKNKYKFEEIYKEPLKYIDGRWVDNRNDLFNVNIENKHKSGIYKIQLNNIIYIGQTVDFKNRYTQHYTNPNGFCKNTQKLLKHGAIFSIIEIIEDKEKRLKKELEYIEKYSNDENYICINEKNNYNKPNKNKKAVKQKYKKIKIKEEDYSKIINFLNKENIFYE